MIHRRRKDYYAQLEAANKALDVDPWLDCFADLVLAAQVHTLQGLDFLLANTRLWDRIRGQLNERQEKALSRLMHAGVEGFVGGLSASKYMAHTGAPAATARRDLGHLVELDALRRTGQLKGTRYWLPHGRVANDGDIGSEDCA
jgi:Fic family protein